MVDGDETLTKDEPFLWQTEFMCVFFSFSSDNRWAKEIEVHFFQNKENF